ncbi:pectinesterase family protein [Pelagicoccus albus]|uniref:Pectinesterase n=1 Tax=Pelagicoccus albus TaxID=415222 RepID=A0A7X1B8E1_9BACT|nr:pectinesterase family protein [Pelagicoccus albus]MBC2607442.1 pectin esterase [Pelagicoccus albus]
MDTSPLIPFRLSALIIALLAILPSAFAEYKTEYTVASDGSGDFFRIQDAIDDCKSFPDLPITIRIKEGRYREKVTVPAWNTKLSLVGEGEVVIAYNSNFKAVDRGRNSTFFTATLEVLANDFTARNITVANTSGPVGQAIALRVEGDRCAFYECKLLGNQDTVYLAGEGNRQYFEKCHIEGTVDYIFGEATAFFEDCVLLCKSGSYITAASTPQSSAYGFVFNRCTVERAEGVGEVYLGRPWRKFARTVFIDCDYGDGINSEGWKNWGWEKPEQTVFYAEYIAKGSKKVAKQRVEWSHQLSKSDLSDYSKESVLAGWEF